MPCLNIIIFHCMTYPSLGYFNKLILRGSPHTSTLIPKTIRRRHLVGINLLERQSSSPDTFLSGLSSLNLMSSLFVPMFMAEYLEQLIVVRCVITLWLYWPHFLWQDTYFPCHAYMPQQTQVLTFKISSLIHVIHKMYFVTILSPQ